MLFSPDILFSNKDLNSSGFINKSLEYSTNG
nr:MAG TPA: hypothetical protein [Bacteriophage sp.]